MSKQIRESISENFGFEPICINSALVSAQNRQRLYWIGKRNENGTYDKVDVLLPIDKGILLKDVIEDAIPVDTTNGKARTIPASYYKAGVELFPTYKAERSRQKIAVPIRIGQIGNGGQGHRIYSIRGKSVTLSANGGGRGAKTGLYKVDLPDGDYIIRKLTIEECKRL